MAKATWNGVTLAESDATVIVDNNHYFPPESLNRAYFENSDHTSRCSWKGMANYYDVVVAGQRNQQAAWYYPDPKEAASEIRDHVAFWKGVQIDV